MLALRIFRYCLFIFQNNMEIKHIFEPTPLQCGQAVLAMVTGKSVGEIVSLLNNERETTLKEMLFVLKSNGFNCSNERNPVNKKEELPRLCFLSLETPKCWHWSLYFEGTFYDPEYGVLCDFPPSNRRYYWEII